MELTVIAKLQLVHCPTQKDTDRLRVKVGRFKTNTSVCLGLLEWAAWIREDIQTAQRNIHQ